MKLSTQYFFSKCDHIRRPNVTFTKEILNEKLHFCAVFMQLETNDSKQEEFIYSI